MAEITRLNGVYYYGQQPCRDADDAYCRFRDDYHKSIGRAVYKRLDWSRERVERTHGFGFVRSYESKPDGREFRDINPPRYYVMGILGISYYYMVGTWTVARLSEEQFDRWFEWAFTMGSNGLRRGMTTGIRAGRTAERYLRHKDKKQSTNKSYGRKRKTERAAAEADL